MNCLCSTCRLTNSGRFVGNPSTTAHPAQGFGSMPMRSLTADRIRCFAPKVAFGRLHRHVPQKKLDLLQLASRSVAEPSTGPSQIVWRQLRYANALGGFLHNVPNRLHRHSISPCPSNFVDPAEKFPSINCSCGEPIVEFGSHPIRNWNCSNVASLANQIRVFLSVVEDRVLAKVLGPAPQSANCRGALPTSSRL